MAHRAYADGPHGQVHFQETVGDGVPVILCHQAPMTSRQFESVYPLFEKQRVRAIGVDYPGFGNSDPTSEPATISDYANAVVAVMDHLDIAQADIVGHHTGALVANELALLHPNRARNIIMHGPTPLTEEEREHWHEYTRINEKEFKHETDGSHLAELFSRRWARTLPGADPALVTRYVVEAMMGLGPFWYGHNAAFNYDHEAALKKLQHRALILTNSGDIIFDLSERAHAMRPDLEYIKMEGGDVDIVDQQSQEWVDIIIEFNANG